MTRCGRTRAVAAGLGLLAATVACGGDESAGDDAGLPAIELPALSAGDPIDLSRLEGPAVVNLWATWCEPCRRELPAFQQASEDHTGVRFLGVDIGEDPDDAQAFLDELGVTFEQYADLDGELTDRLGVASLPVTVVIDGDGEVAEQHLGPMSRSQLDAALAGL